MSTVESSGLSVPYCKAAWLTALPPTAAAEQGKLSKGLTRSELDRREAAPTARRTQGKDSRRGQAAAKRQQTEAALFAQGSEGSGKATKLPSRAERRSHRCRLCGTISLRQAHTFKSI